MELLKGAREGAGLSQRELAQRAGTSQAMVARIERGHQSPSVATLERLVRACGLELRVEAGGGEAPAPSQGAEVRSGRLLVWRSGEAAYAFTGDGPRLDQYQLEGNWSREEEALVLRSSKGGLRMRFSAAKLHLVASAPTPTPIHIRVDGGDARSLQIEHPTLYTLVDGDRYAEHLVEVETDQAGLSLFSATFG